MGVCLDKVVDTYMKHEQVIKSIDKNIPGADDIYNTVKEKLINSITEEICQEQKQKIVQEAEKTISDQRQKKHIKDLSALIWEGFVVAFVVGILVNQVTDVISIGKGSLSQEHIMSTLVIVVIVALVCLLIFGVGYVKRVLDYTKSRE